MLDNIESFEDFKHIVLERLEDVAHLVTIETDNVFEQEEIKEEIKQHLINIMEMLT